MAEMCIYSKHKTLDEFHSGEKNLVTVDGKNCTVLDKYMQLHGQWPKFKDLKMSLWELFRKQESSSIIHKPLFCNPHTQRKICEKEQHEAERKDYQKETFSFTTKLLTICYTLFLTWGLKGIHGLSLGSLTCATGSESYVPISSNSTHSSKI